MESPERVCLKRKFHASKGGEPGGCSRGRMDGPLYFARARSAFAWRFGISRVRISRVRKTSELVRRCRRLVASPPPPEGRQDLREEMVWSNDAYTPPPGSSLD